MPLHIKTPLIESVPMGKITGKKVYLKLECVQAVGSFKIRGIGKLCEGLKEKGYKKFICPSAGNAGYATAWAGKELGVKAVVVAPKGTPQEAINAVQSLGAEVIVFGEVWDEANILAKKMAEDDATAAYISSYEHPDIWSGHATMIDELVEQCEKPDVILCSVGGGGLICGVVEGLDRNGWGDVPVIGCGTYGANAFSETIKAGKLVKLEKTTTLVTCISATAVTQKVVDNSKTHKLIPYLTSDSEAIMACEKLLDDHRLLVDPSCGVTLSAVYGKSPLFENMKNIVVIVCGGVGITYAKLQQLKAKALIH